MLVLPGTEFVAADGVALVTAAMLLFQRIDASDRARRVKADLVVPSRFTAPSTASTRLSSRVI
ncbi:MAG: hypothetical protein J4F37_02355 [Acidobacteria bacterium]|nr:hypothetical protein [Acidobacteriota bacterium]